MTLSQKTVFKMYIDAALSLRTINTHKLIGYVMKKIYTKCDFLPQFVMFLEHIQFESIDLR